MTLYTHLFLLLSTAPRGACSFLDKGTSSDLFRVPETPLQLRSAVPQAFLSATSGISAWTPQTGDQERSYGIPQLACLT